MLGVRRCCYRRRHDHAFASAPDDAPLTGLLSTDAYRIRGPGTGPRRVVRTGLATRQEDP
jgi:hypothetical protein